ncbi:hypothetical protein F5Y14DRAFT_129101 [Nemania sp. NC0429]|nr:hypothetical protein F5Y14DRAFT_129101 [Nemania sp. NC0429]
MSIYYDWRGGEEGSAQVQPPGTATTSIVGSAFNAYGRTSYRETQGQQNRRAATRHSPLPLWLPAPSRLPPMLPLQWSAEDSSSDEIEEAASIMLRLNPANRYNARRTQELLDNNDIQRSFNTQVYMYNTVEPHAGSSNRGNSSASTTPNTTKTLSEPAGSGCRPGLGEGSCHETLEHGSEQPEPDGTGRATTPDSQVTVEGLPGHLDQNHPAMEEREPVKDSGTDPDIQGPSQEEERTQEKRQKRGTRKTRASKLTDLSEKPTAAGGSSRKEAIDPEVAKVTAEYMGRAKGDHMKAAGFWFERTERKNDEPWAGLQRGEEFIEDMKKDILDPAELRRYLEEEEEEEEERKRKQKSKRIRRRRHPPRAKEQGGSSSPYMSRALKIAQEEPLRTALKETSGDPGPSLMRSAQYPEILASLEDDMDLFTEPSNKDTPPPTQPKDHDPPPETPKKRKRSSGPEILESDLGKGWDVHITDDGHRPCTRSQPANNSSSSSSSQK